MGDAALRDAGGATTTATSFGQGRFQRLAGVDSGIGGGGQQDGRWGVQRGQKNGSGLRGETLRQGAEFFETSLFGAARDAADAIDAGGGVLIEFPALVGGESEVEPPDLL